MKTAAAPDMLAVLQEMDKLSKCKLYSEKWMLQADKCEEMRLAAIKKATT